MAPVSRSERRRLRNAPGLFETLKDDICHVGVDLKKRGWRREIGASFSGLDGGSILDGYAMSYSSGGTGSLTRCQRS
jgi:hypothetical protein